MTINDVNNNCNFSELLRVKRIYFCALAKMLKKSIKINLSYYKLSCLKFAKIITGPISNFKFNKFTHYHKFQNHLIEELTEANHRLNLMYYCYLYQQIYRWYFYFEKTSSCHKSFARCLFHFLKGVQYSFFITENNCSLSEIKIGHKFMDQFATDDNENK